MRRPSTSTAHWRTAAPTTSSAAFSSGDTVKLPARNRERSSRSATMRVSRSACSSISAARRAPVRCSSCASALIDVNGVRRSCDTEASTKSFIRPAACSAAIFSASSASRARSSASAA